MKCIEIAKPGGPEQLVLAERDEPTPGPGAVRIRVGAAGVNRPDCLQRQGVYPPPPGASDIPGLEVAGIIDTVGEGVSAWKSGDHVCALVTGGGYAEWVIAPQETLLRIPAHMPIDQAAGLPETLFTVWSTVFMRAGLKAGETLLVHGGSSGIGTTAIQLAKAFGAEVITTAGSAAKCDLCRTLGADLAINYKDRDFEEAVRAHSDGVDVVLDMVGGPYIPKNIALLRPDGRHVSIAFLQGAKAEVNFAQIMMKRLMVTGATLRARDTTFKGEIARQLADRVWPLLDQGRIRVVIDSRFDLAEASAAHARMESSDHMGKILLIV